LAYNILAPSPRARRFNLFQEFVLKLCGAGTTTAREIGERLGFGTELAAYIILQLQGLGLLDVDALPTRRAVRELEEAEEEAAPPVSGYVFQDPFTGTLWPRFMEGPLRPAEVIASKWEKDRGARLVKFEAGPVGDPVRGTAVSVEPPKGWRRTVETPGQMQILAACRQHAYQERNHRRVCGAAEAELPPRDVGAADAERVTRLTRHLEPAYLLTFLFVPENVMRASYWQVCDPFGLGPDAALRKRVEEVAQGAGGAVVQEELEKLTRRSFEVSAVDMAELVATRQRWAAASVERQLGEEIRRYPELQRCLAHAEESLAEVREQTKAAGQAYWLERDRRKDFVARAHAAIEELCAAVRRLYVSGDTLAALSPVPEENGQLLAEFARRAGFTDDADGPALPFFLAVSRAAAKKVTDHDQRGLREQAAVLLAEARDLPEHPLYRLAADFPGSLLFFVDLKAQRDRGTHAAGGEVERREEDFMVNVYRCVRGLLPEMKMAGDAETETRAPGGLEVIHKLRARAAFRIESRLPGRGRDLPAAVFAPLVEMQTRAEELETMAGQPEADDAAGSRLTSLVNKACEALEAALAMLLRSVPRPSPDSLQDGDKQSLAARCAEAARAAGFDAPTDGLPENYQVPPDKVVRTLRSCSGTLNAEVLALLLTTEGRPDHPLCRVATDRPDFLLVLADLADRRGHGGRARMERHEVPDVTATVLELIRDILAVVAW
jgi:hypothetical protein